MECSTRRSWKECPRRCDAGSAKPMPTVMVPSPVKNSSEYWEAAVSGLLLGVGETIPDPIGVAVDSKGSIATAME